MNDAKPIRKRANQFSKIAADNQQLIFHLIAEDRKNEEKRT